jgi:transcriptional regulator with XRE-family HTH domain
VPDVTGVEFDEMTPKSPNPIDKYVGSRVRMRRIMLSMSQEKLGEALGLTFQQVQKYEKGTNRIGASRLQQISDILQVPVSFLFEGGPAGPNAIAGLSEAQSPAYVSDFLATSEGLALTRAFTRITDARLRRSIVELVEQMAAREQTISLELPASMRVERTRFMQQNQIHSRFHKITMGGQGRQMTKSADDIASQAQGAGHGSFFGRRKAQASQSSDRPDGASAAAAHADLAAADVSDPAALFDAPVSELRLEIGFGGGEHLAAEALAYPQTGFIGCEPYVNGMAKIVADRSEQHHQHPSFRGRCGRASCLGASVELQTHRSHSSRSMAQAAALEASLRAGRNDHADVAHPRSCG